MLCWDLVEQVGDEHLSDEYSNRYINCSIAEAFIFLLQTIRDHHNGSRPELTNVGKVIPTKH